MKAVNRVGVTCGVLAAILLAASSVLAEEAAGGRRGWGHPCGAGMGRGHRFGMRGPGGKLPEELGLTEEQKGQLKEAMGGRREEMKAAMESVFKARRALQGVVTSDSASEEAIQKAAADLSQAIANRAVLASKARAEMRKVLTPEQIKKLDELKASREDAMKERRQRFAGPKTVE